MPNARETLSSTHRRGKSWEAQAKILLEKDQSCVWAETPDGSFILKRAFQFKLTH